MKIKLKLSQALIKTGSWIFSVGVNLHPKPIRAEFEKRLPKWKQLWFVVDIPLFSDAVAVEKLYDALNRPEFETKSRKTTNNAAISKELSGELSGSGSSKEIADFLKISTTAKFSGKRTKTEGKSIELNQERNFSTEMQIERIINYYAWHYPDRIFWAKADLSEVFNTDGSNLTWDEVSKLINSPAPRPIIIFEAVSDSKIIPMAIETTDGKHIKVSENYIKKIKRQNKAIIPPYSSSPGASQKHWEALEKYFDSTEAMKAIEDSTKNGSRIDWIDYRLISRSGSNIIPIHLHLTPRGNYNTGTFAYQMVRRGYKHGIKIIGTLKKGEDINVLAIYEN
ncbi:hypothetical protein [Pseudomonas aeruginosa]|uniref:hypothetical protein n=1 Tax=Pseudomonas aeruginosa TaxID=287 RepID=UPI003CC6D5A0